MAILKQVDVCGGFSFRNFYAHRVKRLFPALIAVVSVVLGAGCLLLFKRIVSQSRYAASYIFEIFEKNQWKKARVFWVIQLVVISVSLVGVLLLTYYFTGIHEVVLFLVGLFFVGNFTALHFQKRKYGEKMGFSLFAFCHYH